MNRKPTWPFGTRITSNQHAGLVGWWPLAPVGGSIAYELQRGNQGTITDSDPAVLWVADGERGGNVLQLDGTAHVNVGDIALVDDLGTSAELTWSLWVRIDNLGVTETILDKFSSNQGSKLVWNSTNGWRFDIDTVGAYTGTTGFVANTWYHISVVYNGNLTGDTNRLKIYVDGVNQTLTYTATVPASITSNATSLRFGKDNAGGTSLNGALDDIRLYDRELFSSEIGHLWNVQTRWELYEPTEVSAALLIVNTGIIATGGVVVNGSAIDNIIDNHTATGGVVAGGTAANTIIDNHTATGGVVAGGTATVEFVANVTATGGVVVAGNALVVSGNDIIATGGVVAAGVSSTAATYNITATGGMVAGGTATNNIIDNHTATGGVVVNGAASIQFGVFGTGGAVVGGSAVVAFLDTIDTTGGVVVAGDAILEVNKTGDSTGGVVVAGVAVNQHTMNEVATGGVVIAGMVSILGEIFGEGGAVVGGSAIISFSDVIDTTGGVVCGGTADVFVQRDEVATGGVVVNGTVPYDFSANLIATGGVVVNGTHDQQLTFANVATGGMVAGGHAPLNYEPDASGGVVVGGSATGQTINIEVSGGAVVGGSAIVEDDKIFLIVECPEGLYVCEPKGEDSYCLRYIDYISNGSPVFKDISKTVAKMPPIILCRQGVKNDLVIADGEVVGGRSQKEELGGLGGMGLMEFTMLSTVEAPLTPFKFKAHSNLKLDNFSPVKSSKTVETTKSVETEEVPLLSNLAMKAEFRREHKGFKKNHVSHKGKTPGGNIATNTPQMARLRRANEEIRQRRYTHVSEEQRTVAYSRGDQPTKAPSKPDKPKITQTAL